MDVLTRSRIKELQLQLKPQDSAIHKKIWKISCQQKTVTTLEILVNESASISIHTSKSTTIITSNLRHLLGKKIQIVEEVQIKNSNHYSINYSNSPKRASIAKKEILHWFWIKQQYLEVMQVLDPQSQIEEQVGNRQADLESRTVIQLRARNDWWVLGSIRQSMMI